MALPTNCFRKVNAWYGTGLKLGEEIAIRYLQLHAKTYHEKNFNGFELTKCDGTRIRITTDQVISLH